MNKLKTNYTGGYPLKINDLDWMQEGYKEIFKALISPYLVDGDDVLILSGVEKVSFGLGFHITAGFVYISGEIYRFQESEFFPILGYNPGFVIEDFYDSSGLKVFKDGVSHETYHAPFVKVEFLPSSPEFPFLGAKRLDEHFLRANTEDIVYSDPSWPLQEITASRDALGVVRLNGKLELEDLLAGEYVLFSLPIKYRPSRDYLNVMFATDTSTLTGVVVKVKTNGEVSVGVPNGGIHGAISLDGVVYNSTGFII